MENILSFVREHLELCLACIVSLITLLLQVLKKRPVKVIDGVEDLLLKILPGAILYAERKVGAGHGQAKMTEVLALCSEYIKERYPDVNFGLYTPFIKEYVENILSTPQKKGD